LVTNLSHFLSLKFTTKFFQLFSRSRDRFLESSQQIEALVERFSRETNISDGPPNSGVVGKIPLAYGKPSEFKVWGILFIRMLASTFSCGLSGLKTIFLRIFAMPVALSILWLFYSQVGVSKREMC
jgi:ATP-binding cassette, subfamily G (WHITE), member 5 (sterolin 1)